MEDYAHFPSFFAVFLLVWYTKLLLIINGPGMWAAVNRYRRPDELYMTL